MAAQTRRGWIRWGLAVVYAAAVLWICGVIPAWGRWYFAGPYHREETAAILQGGLALSHDPSDLAFDLCWAQGGVQQVWGLGIPLWRMPFDLVARCFGQPAFPDAFVMAAALIVLAWLVLKAFSGPAADAKFLSGLGAVLILLVFPPFLSLLGAGLSIHSAVMVYVYLYGVALVCGLVALTRKPTWPRFWILCGLAGAGGLVRPTLVFYGMATLLTASAVMATAALPGRLGKRLLFGGGLFALGGMILWWTNYVRFGSGFEFGHRLNVQSDWLRGVISYSTRFDYPYQDEPWPRAARELFGALFQVQRFGFPTGAGELYFPGQSSAPRYREFLFTTFDIWCAVLVVAGWIAGIWSFRKQRAAALVAAWSFLATAPLLAFYLWAPFLVDRYMIDFAPAFAAAILVFWQGSAEWVGAWRWRWGRFVLFAALCAWLTWELSGIRNDPHVHSMTWPEAAQETARPARPFQGSLPNHYELGDHLADWGIPFNGAGWAERDGKVAACVTLYVSDPAFLEIVVTPAAGTPLSAADAEAMRAKIGLEYLTRASLEPVPGGWRLRFAGPTQPRYRHGVQPVFLATVAKEHLFDEARPWVLKRVAWRP